MARLGAGDAAAQTGRSLDLARLRGERGAEARALRLQAEIEAHGDSSVGSAERLYRQALALATELGMQPLEAHCRLGLGRLLRRVGRHHEALAELDAAIDVFSELGMVRWLLETETVRAAVAR